MSTRVSVIIPVFNRERYVRECVESVLATRYPNLEVLIVDDGSTDGSPAILAELHSQNRETVRLLHHAGRRNLGQMPSRNLALSQASGEYVCFLDSDDLMLPHRFEKAISMLDEDPTLDGVIEVTELFFENADQVARWGERAPRYGPRVDSIPAEDFLAAWLLERKCSMLNCNLIVRVRLLEKSGLFRPMHVLSEDLHLWLRMVACGRFAVGEAERPVTLYRRHADNDWTPSRADSMKDIQVLGDVFAWARRSPHVPPRNVAVLREAYRRKGRWCLTMLRGERDRKRLAGLARRLLTEDPSWALDRGFVANVTRGLLERSSRPSVWKVPSE